MTTEISVAQSYYVYCYKKPNGDVFYIGKGKGTRSRSHLLLARKSFNDKEYYNKYVDNKENIDTIHDIMSKGELPLIEIVSCGMTEEDAYNLEIDLIEHYGRLDLGTGLLTNKNGGGCNPTFKLSPEKRELMINRMKGNKLFKGHKHTEEAKELNRQARLGKKLTEETKKKLSNIFSGKGNPMYGKKHTSSAIEKQREASTGVIPSEETRKKMSESAKGENNSMYGMTGKKNKLSKKVRQLSRDRKVIIAEFHGVAEAERQLRAQGYNVYKQGIGKCARTTDRDLSHAGFCWEYIDEFSV